MSIPEWLCADSEFFRRATDGVTAIREIHRDYESLYSWDTVWKAVRLARSMKAKSSSGITSPKEETAPETACGGRNGHSESIAETHEQKGDSWAITLPKTRISTLSELLEHCKVDTSVWEVERFIVNKWEVGAKVEGVLQVEPLFQVKAFLRKKVKEVAVRDEVNAMLVEARLHVPAYPNFIRPHSGERHLLELSIPDLHNGKLAWAEEAGEDYDLSISKGLFDEALADLLSKTAAYPIERICFVVGNDLLHTDTNKGTTYSGTRLDTDTRHQRVFRETRQLMVKAIDQLLSVADVDVVMVPGNHDRESVFYLGDALDCWYHKCEQVRIDNRASLRKYYEYGRTMLLLTHGSEEKWEKLPSIMAIEQPQMWGRTLFREAHIGHQHRNLVKPELDEQTGVRVRMLPSLCASDGWHAEKGFVGNIRSAQALVWHPERGLVGQHHYNVLPITVN